MKQEMWMSVLGLATASMVGCGEAQLDEYEELPLGENSQSLVGWDVVNGDTIYFEHGYGWNNNHSKYEGGLLNKFNPLDYCEPFYRGRDCMVPSSKTVNIRVAIPNHYAPQFQGGMTIGYQEAISDLRDAGWFPQLELVWLEENADIVEHEDWLEDTIFPSVLVYQMTSFDNAAPVVVGQKPGVSPNDDNDLPFNTWTDYYFRGKVEVRVDDTDIFFMCPDDSPMAVANRIAYFTKRGILNAFGIGLTDDVVESTLMSSWAGSSPSCTLVETPDSRELTYRERKMLEEYERF